MKRYRATKNDPLYYPSDRTVEGELDEVYAIVKRGRQEVKILFNAAVEYGWLTEVKEPETLAEKEAFRERVRIAIDGVFKNWWGEEHPNNKFLIELRRSIESVE